MIKYLSSTFLLFCCLYQQNVIANTYDYSISVSKNLKRVTVELCFKDIKSKQNIILSKGNKSAYARISNINLQQGNLSKKINLSNKSINLTDVIKNDCLSYESELVFKAGRKIPGISHDNQIITDPNQWLWLPQSFGKQDRVNLQFSHPQQMSISAPWTLITRTKTKTSYSFKKRPSEWDCLVVFGYFEIKDFRFKNATIRYALLNGHKKIDQNKIYTWLDNNIKALNTVYNRFPVMSLQILVIPLGKGDEPVPWAEVMRGGGDAVHLYIDDRRSQQEFLDDWVLSHELSHLLLPRMTGNDVWLSEGIASYYQNIIRARQGLLSTQQAWGKLHAGFQRGINKTTKSRTLAEESSSMWKSRNYMRVYWSGAAISLLVDVKLRSLGSKNMSLDNALDLLQQCCSSDYRWWTAEEVMIKLDDLSKTRIFSETLNSNLHATTFPDLKKVYNILGLQHENNSFSVLENPRYVIRNNIMTVNK